VDKEDTRRRIDRRGELFRARRESNPSIVVDHTRRAITMAIGDGMLAQVLLDYFQQHAEEFEQFLLERAGIGEGYVRWRGEETQKRLVLKITTLGSGPSIVAEREYAMKIETI
jgi:hypothetical protein